MTSGYIIPNIRTVSYRLNHYDVIVYDALNSPVLWAENNPDNSEQGRSRAIPAEYVHAVFEVKATFNKQSIKEAKEKLNELQSCSDHLHEFYISGLTNPHIFRLTNEIVVETALFARTGGVSSEW